MKVNYDATADRLTLIFRDVMVAASAEKVPGIIFDYDAGGDLISVEVLDASRRVDEPGKVILSNGK